MILTFVFSTWFSTRSQNKRIDDLAVSLHSEMKAGFAAVDRRFEEVDRRFEAVDRRFDGIDRRLERIEAKLDNHAETSPSSKALPWSALRIAWESSMI